MALKEVSDQQCAAQGCRIRAHERGKRPHPARACRALHIWMPVPRDPKRLLVVSCRLVLVEHEDGETLTRFASDVTLIERRGAGISGHAIVARDIAGDRNADRCGPSHQSFG